MTGFVLFGFNEADTFESTMMHNYQVTIQSTNTQKDCMTP